MRDSVLDAFFKLSASARDNLTIRVEASSDSFSTWHEIRRYSGPAPDERSAATATYNFHRAVSGSAHPNNGAGRVYSALFVNHVLCAALMLGVRVLG